MKNRRFNTASFMENLWGERHSTSRVHLISVGIHFDIFWERSLQCEIFLEGGQERKTGYYEKRVSIIKAVLFKEVISIKAPKSARSRKYLQSADTIFFKLSCISFYFILYFILFYHFFAYLFIYFTSN